MGELKETPVLVRIAIYGRLTTDRLIPLRWHSLLSELQRRTFMKLPGPAYRPPAHR
jgi:hypothetical protein